MALDAHQIEPAQELIGIVQSGHPQRPQPRPVIQRPGFNLWAWPGDIAIAQQRHKVVSHRSDHCVLKIQHTRIIRVGHHQIARVIIAMHPDLRLLQRIGGQGGKGLVKGMLLRHAQFQRQQPTQKPVAEQVHLPM